MIMFLLDMQQQRSVKLFENMQQKLPNWRVYPTLGNHESFPVDQFGTPPQMQWLYESVKLLHENHLFKCQGNINCSM